MRILFLVIVLLAAGVFTATAQTFTEKEFKPLHGLAGVWKMETSRGAIYEEWQVSASHKLLGKSYRLSNTDTVVMEQIELFLKDGAIVYSPVVRGQNSGQAVAFRLSGSLDINRYVFENKEHDFPQRVIYQLVSKDSVHARIEGIRNGAARGSDFLYSRVK